MVFFHSGSIWRLYLAGAFLLITNGGDQSSESRCDTPLFLPPKETTATLSFCHKIRWHVVLLMIFLTNDKTPRIWTNSKPSVDPIASYNMPPHSLSPYLSSLVGLRHSPAYAYMKEPQIKF